MNIEEQETQQKQQLNLSQNKSVSETGSLPPLPPGRTIINGNMKQVISFYYKGNRIWKRTEWYKIVKKTIRVNKNILRRMKLAKFGRAVNDPPNSSAVLEDEIELILQDVKSIEKQRNGSNLQGKFGNTNGVSNSKEGTYIPYHKRKQMGLITEDKISDTANTNTANANIADSNTYTPPSKRGNYDTYTTEEITTIRVSNIPKHITEDNLMNLFSPYGGIRRIKIPLDRKTQESRGFAFITFYSRRDAEYALNEMDRSRIGYLIVNIDWSDY